MIKTEPPIVHELDISPYDFNDIRDQGRRFETAFISKKYNIHDYVLFKENYTDGYTGRSILVKVKTIMTEGPGIKEMYAIIGFSVLDVR